MITHITTRKSKDGLFAKLISVTITASDHCSSYYPNLVEDFASLPSVKIINIDSMRDSEEPLEATVTTTDSKATDLNISNGDLSPARLMLVLQSFEWLQSFTYWPMSDHQQKYKFDPFLIVVTLLACAQDSLREVQIRARSDSGKYMGSLRKFRVLECLDTDFTLLFGQDEEATQDFSSSLPPSIQEIKLHCWDQDFYYLRKPFADLRESRNDFPRLRNIEVFGNGFPEDGMAKYRDMCAEIDISLQSVQYADVPLPVYNRHSGHYAERQARKALALSESL